MQRARNSQNAYIYPEKGLSGYCIGCGGEVRAHCGEIYAWHWHHVNGLDCDSWGHPMTKWHFDWQRKFAINEMWRTKEGESHRADVVTNFGFILEFQNSSISPEQIRDRENFWGNMAWVFNAEEFKGNFDFYLNPKEIKFVWNNPRKIHRAAQKPIYYDFGNMLMRIISSTASNPSRGICYFIPHEQFVRAMNKYRP